MSHLPAATLRKMLDAPHSMTAEQRSHLTGCAECKRLAAQVVRDARRAAGMLESAVVPVVDPVNELEQIRSSGSPE